LFRGVAVKVGRFIVNGTNSAIEETIGDEVNSYLNEAINVGTEKSKLGPVPKK
jgi:hypothetical protein